VGPVGMFFSWLFSMLYLSGGQIAYSSSRLEAKEQCNLRKLTVKKALRDGMSEIKINYWKNLSQKQNYFFIIFIYTFTF